MNLQSNSFFINKKPASLFFFKLINVEWFFIAFKINWNTLYSKDLYLFSSTLGYLDIAFIPELNFEQNIGNETCSNKWRKICLKANTNSLLWKLISYSSGKSNQKSIKGIYSFRMFYLLWNEIASVDISFILITAAYSLDVVTRKYMLDV